MSNELKPCPFCGGEVSKLKYFNNQIHENLWQIGCDECEFYMEQPFEQEAIKAWNTRTPDPLLAECVDNYRQIVFCAFNMLNRRGTAGQEIAKDLKEGYGKIAKLTEKEG